MIFRLEVYSVHDQQNYSSENEDDADEQRGFEQHKLYEVMCKGPDNGCWQECNQNGANPRTLQFGQGTCREQRSFYRAKRYWMGRFDSPRSVPAQSDSATRFHRGTQTISPSWQRSRMPKMKRFRLDRPGVIHQRIGASLSSFRAYSVSG